EQVIDLGRSFESADGTFELSGLRAGDWLMTAARPNAIRSSPITVRVPQQGDAPVFVCPRGASVLGFVLDARDKPVAGARVYASYAGGDEVTLHMGSDPEADAHSDEQGHFRMADLQPGSFELMATSQESDSD